MNMSSIGNSNNNACETYSNTTKKKRRTVCEIKKADCKAKCDKNTTTKNNTNNKVY